MKLYLNLCQIEMVSQIVCKIDVLVSFFILNSLLVKNTTLLSTTLLPPLYYNKPKHDCPSLSIMSFLFVVVILCTKLQIIEE